jgi:hypothetical protein
VIVLREVLQVRWGKADELLRAMREDLLPMAQEAGIHGRIFTDLGGPLFTVVIEAELASLVAWEQFQARATGDPRVQETGVAELLIAGRREFFTVAAQI